MRNGLVIYGPPAARLNTVTQALGEIDSRFVRFQQVTGRDDAFCGLDRPGLLQQVADGFVPVVQLAQAADISAIMAADLPVEWLAIWLSCPPEVSEHQVTEADYSRDSEQSTVGLEADPDRPVIDPALFDLTLNTCRLSSHTVAELVARTVALRPRSNASSGGVARRAKRLFGRPRYIGYLQQCQGSEQAALELYRWNNAISAAMWEAIGYLEIALRNALATRMSDRHHRLRRRGSWLDDPHQELDSRSRDDILKARGRVVRKRKPASDGQTIAELGFGFWRYLLARRYSSSLWPDLAGAFPNAPDRARETVELPVIRLHEFRNRIAHHERVWTTPLRELYAELLEVIAYIDQDLSCWIADQCSVDELLGSCPQELPNL